jgi:hypothetical protein
MKDRPLILVVLAILALWALSGCTSITVTKPDGTRIVGNSLFQDIAIPRMSFAATRPTSGPASEQFSIEGYDQKARLEVFSKMLDLMGKP